MIEVANARALLMPDTAFYRTRRAELLEFYEVTEEDLIRFAETNAGDPDLMLRLYDRLGVRIDSLARPAVVPQPRFLTPSGAESETDSLVADSP